MEELQGVSEVPENPIQEIDLSLFKTRPGMDPYAIPLEDYNVANPELYKYDAWRPFFKRLRDEAPVHYCADSYWGPYWSISSFEDIQYVDSNHELFSSEPNITIGDVTPDFEVNPGFIAKDPPIHDLHRATVQSVVAPQNLMKMEPLIRERVIDILDHLPVGEPFNWVQLVSRELTTRMLATLFDFPFEDRNKLTFWSDVATSGPLTGGSMGQISEMDRRKHLMECLQTFTGLWNQRVNKEPSAHLDLVTMLAQGEHTRNMTPLEYLGTLILLIVGGNDTTRNSLSGGVVALNQNPGEYDKLRNDPSLIPNMVSEIIRWQTPLAHMRRTVKQDTEVKGQKMKAGDKVVMWYLSGNRDDKVIERADDFWIDRPRARHHMAFGFGIHRCMGNRLAEMQLRIAWEEILKRFHTVEVVEEPVRVLSNFVRGFETVMVKVHPH